MFILFTKMTFESSLFRVDLSFDLGSSISVKYQTYSRHIGIFNLIEFIFKL